MVPINQGECGGREYIHVSYENRKIIVSSNNYLPVYVSHENIQIKLPKFIEIGFAIKKNTICNNEF